MRNGITFKIDGEILATDGIHTTITGTEGRTAIYIVLMVSVCMSNLLHLTGNWFHESITAWHTRQEQNIN
ncbi:MAG: hypothetical protein M0P26_04760 [Bacteroidales bacterium]|nr:hypothetical protein [Bacteroidales bacterium]